MWARVVKVLIWGLQEIFKHHPSSFTGTDLDAHLKKLGKSKIVLVGMYLLTVFEVQAVDQKIIRLHGESCCRASVILSPLTL